MAEPNPGRGDRPVSKLMYIVGALIFVIVVVLLLRSCSTEDNAGPSDTVLPSTAAAGLAPPTDPGAGNQGQ